MGVCGLLVSCGESTPTTESTTTPSPVIVTTTTSTLVTTTTTLGTTTTLSQEELDAIQFESDVELIVALWRGFSDSWFENLDAAYEYTAAHNYPDEGCTASDYEDLEGYSDGTRQEVIVLQETIERDDGWTVSGGNMSGQTPDGPIYIFQALFSFVDPGFAPQESRAEVHTAIKDGEAFFFITCR
jgi:hypothetical protein